MFKALYGGRAGGGVIDFFAGPARAITVLNTVNRGSRISVSVTTNEVGDADRATLSDTSAGVPKWDVRRGVQQGRPARV